MELITAGTPTTRSASLTRLAWALVRTMIAMSPADSGRALRFIAISDSELANQIETEEISDPPPAVPKAIPTLPTIPFSPLEPDEFEIGAKEVIDPDDIPRAAPMIREEEEPSDSLESDEAAVGSDIPSDQTEADVDIWSVEE